MRNDFTIGLKQYGRQLGVPSCARIGVPPSLARPGLFGD